MSDQATETHDEWGRPVVYSSPRPPNTTTIFLGAGDSGGAVGAGDRLLWNMGAGDSVKSVDMTFGEDIYIKDGYIIVENAPFGAYLDAMVVHPAAGIVGSFAHKAPLLGSGWFPLDTEDKGTLPAGLILRLSVYNSSGQDGQDPAAAFKAAGRIEVYRETQL